MATTYHLGQRVRLSAVVQVDGADSDPSTGFMCVRRKGDPDTDILTYALTGSDVVKDSVGHYHLNFLAPKAGDWYYVLVVKGAGGDADEQTADEAMFKVETSQFPDSTFALG